MTRKLLDAMFKGFSALIGSWVSCFQLDLVTRVETGTIWLLMRSRCCMAAVWIYALIQTVVHYCVAEEGENFEASNMNEMEEIQPWSENGDEEKKMFGELYSRLFVYMGGAVSALSYRMKSGVPSLLESFKAMTTSTLSRNVRERVYPR